MIDQSSKTLESMSQATWYNRWTKKQFSNYLTPPILEIGCGIGNFTSFLAKYGHLLAIDINEDYIKEAKKRVQGKAQIGFGDVESGKYFFKERNFSTVVCINVLEHIKDDKAALKNIHKLLATNRILILLVPAHQFLYNLIDQSIGHYRRYERGQLERLLKECNFEIVKIRNLNFLGSIGWFIAGKFFKETQVSEGKIKIFNLISPIFLLLENIFEPPVGTSILVIARKINK